MIVELLFFLPSSSSSGLLLREEHVDYFLLCVTEGSHCLIGICLLAVAPCVETHCDSEIITVDQENTTGSGLDSPAGDVSKVEISFYLDCLLLYFSIVVNCEPFCPEMCISQIVSKQAS